MKSETKKILLLGSYGQSNLGDEEILNEFIKFFKSKHCHVFVNSSSPEKTEKKYLVDSFSTSFLNSKDIKEKIRALLVSDIYVFGGGSVLIEHAKENLKWYNFPNRPLYLSLFLSFLGKLLGKKVVFSSIGVGPLKSSKAKFLAKTILSLADQVTVRDLESKRLALSLVKKDIKVVADIVLVKKPIRAKAKKQIVIFPSWHLPLSKSKKEQVSKLLVSVVNYYTDRGYKVIFVPLWYDFSPINDYWYAKKLLKMGAKAKVQVFDSLDKLSQVLNKSEFSISERLHGAIFSSLCGVPFLAVNYNPKVAGFVGMINRKFLIELNQLNFGLISKKLRRLKFGSEERKSFGKLQKKALETFRYLSKLL